MGSSRLRGGRALFFFFQAEDGIRDLTVTGVQTCALPICVRDGCEDGALRGIFWMLSHFQIDDAEIHAANAALMIDERNSLVLELVEIWTRAVAEKKIGRASCRERV